MAQPSNVPRWNTDGSNRTDPPSGQKDTGQVAGAPLDSSYYNWIHFNIYEWVLYLQSLTSEALTWLVLQTFSAGIVVTRVAAGNTITATANGGASAYAVIGTGGAGAFSHGGHFISNASVSGIGAYGEGSVRGVVGFCTDGDANSYGVLGVSNGAAVGVAGSSDTGAAGSFSSSAGKGIVVQGGTNKDGTESAGNGTGRGGLFTGGQSAAGVRGVGGTGGVGVSGHGGQFQGGSPTIGTGSHGVYGIGGNAASGGLFEAGAGSAPGVIGTGGTGGGPGIRANNGAGVVGPAVDCRGTVDFANATPPAIGIATQSKLTRNSFAKAWVLIQCNGTAAPTILDGQNVTSVVQSIAGGTNGELTVTLANAMASTDYAMIPLFQNVLGGDRPLCYPKTVTSSSVFILEGQTTAGVIMTAVAWNTRRLYIEIMGAQ